MLLRQLGTASVLVGVLATNIPAQQVPSISQQVSRIKASVLAGPSMSTLRELCEQFGPRVTGSPAYQQAAEWAANQLRQSGIENVRLESFTIPNGWQRGRASGQMYSPFEKQLHIEPVGWSPSTPAGGIRSTVVAISDISEAAIREKGPAIRDHVVLLNANQIFADGFKKNYAKFVASYSTFKQVGAAALLLPETVPNNAPGDWVDTDNGAARVLPLPVAEIGMEDAKLMFDLLEEHPVSIGFEYANQVTGPTEVNNVIGEIRGSEKPDEWILVGAHLDSWDLGMGAQDNGTGSVMVLDAARAIAGLGTPPRRSIRFALWTGEEPGLLGSKTYVKAHSTELRQCVAVLNTDAGAGHPQGWKVDGRYDLRDAMTPLVTEHLRDLGGDGLSLKINVDTDHAPFMLQGIPALDLWVDTSHYEDVAHKSGDTFDKVDPVNFKADVAVLAVTAYIVAQLPQPIAAHIDHAAVGQIIKNAELDGYLTAHGDWQP